MNLSTNQQSEQVFKDKTLAFYGSAKVQISRLQHENSLQNPRQLDPQNVERLLKVFQLEGCLRLEAENHVPALIARSTLDQALHESMIHNNLKSFNEPPILNLSGNAGLVYLHGQHRLEAAQKHLQFSDRWWVVDLYSEDLTERAKIILREEYSNAQRYFDGDIFRHLRSSQKNNDLMREHRWLARLTKRKRADLSQLEKRAKKEHSTREFRDSLDALLDFTGLWPAMLLGTFHRLLSLRCPEEMTHYLNRIGETWRFILGEDPALHRQLDAQTVRVLEGRCARYSLIDQSYIRDQMSQQTIFSAVKTLISRDQIFARICEIGHTIPSLHTFLEDTKYLEPCAKIMKCLLPNKFKGSIREAYQSMHNGQTDFKMEYKELSSADSVQRSSDMAFWGAYRQLWLFAMRHFPEMTAHQPRQEPAHTPHRASKPNSRWLHYFATLAFQCGFEGIRKPDANSKDTEMKMIMDLVTAFASTTQAQITTEQSLSYGESIWQLCKPLLMDIQHDETPSSHSLDLVTDVDDGSTRDIMHRCGTPHEVAYEKDLPYLFLCHVYLEENIVPSRFLTSFAIQRDFFHGFFGRLLQNFNCSFHSSNAQTDASYALQDPMPIEPDTATEFNFDSDPGQDEQDHRFVEQDTLMLYDNSFAQRASEENTPVSPCPALYFLGKGDFHSFSTVLAAYRGDLSEKGFCFVLTYLREHADGLFVQKLKIDELQKSNHDNLLEWRFAVGEQVPGAKFRRDQKHVRLNQAYTDLKFIGVQHVGSSYDVVWASKIADWEDFRAKFQENQRSQQDVTSSPHEGAHKDSVHSEVSDPEL